MAKEDVIQRWIEIVQEDLSVAEDLYKTKHWLYVAFMCHQVIEKILKAYWTAIRDDKQMQQWILQKLSLVMKQ